MRTIGDFATTNEVAADEVRGNADALHADRRSALAALVGAGEVGGSHQPLDPLPPGKHALAAELSVDARGAVRLTAALVDRADLLDEPGVVKGALRGLPPPPSVEARAGDAEQPAAERDRKGRVSAPMN